MNNSVIYTQANKGSVIVVLDGKMYVSKVTEVLQDTETYEIIKRNPTKGIVTSCEECL